MSLARRFPPPPATISFFLRWWHRICSFWVFKNNLIGRSHFDVIILLNVHIGQFIVLCTNQLKRENRRRRPRKHIFSASSRTPTSASSQMPISASGGRGPRHHLSSAAVYFFPPRMLTSMPFLGNLHNSYTPGPAVYLFLHNLGPFCADKLLRKKGPCRGVNCLVAQLN